MISPDISLPAPGAPCLVLLSGGMDSTTCLYWVRSQRPEDPLHTVSIDYGQRHRVELHAAAELSHRVEAASHRVLSVDLSPIGGSPLTDAALDLPTASECNQIATVVPFRNLLFVTLAAACAEVADCHDIFIAPVLDDHRAYRDCRRDFYDSLEQTLRLGATRDATFHIHTALVEMSKSDVVALGLTLGVPYEITHTCYTGRRPACGRCDACSERLAAFAANGIVDPLAYELDLGADGDPWDGAE
ncbi:MAG: 7-cyano-7-deazaguanine synthase QueC [Candidatus Latescibacterota bacterium]|nr:7-cyano-7-deazaguanine synthase QueC [Candidatus Latescibacterota bacterium]